MPHRIDTIDHRLLDEFQRGLALAPQPYAAIGKLLDIDEGEVIKRLGFAVPNTEEAIARLAQSITELALHGIGGGKMSAKKRKHSP